MNNSCNATDQTSSGSSYIFNPVQLGIKLGIACPSIAAGLYSLITNSLILYFMYKKSKIVQTGSFRRLTTEYFISSLALSDVLCSLLSLPLFVTEMFVDYINTDVICKLTRCIWLFFPSVTSMNYLFLGTERFMMIHFPYVVPSKTACKKLVVAAWLSAAVIASLAIVTAVRVQFDLSHNTHTMLCMYDQSVPYRRNSFIACLLLVYIIPLIVHIISSALIIRKMRQQKASIGAIANQENLRERTSRFKVTNMFISLIFVFIIPYMLFVCYNAANILLKLNTSLTVDFASRMAGTSLVYANGALGSTILFSRFPYLRNSLMALLYSVFPRKEIRTTTNEYQSNIECGEAALRK